jgi:hypothetical protein
MDPGNAYWRIVHQVWNKISIYDGEEVFASQFNRANTKQRYLFAAYWCQSEVRNGGFHQFFWNSAGILAPESIVAFRAIKMPNAAHLIEKAMMFFGPIYPRDRNKRIEMLNTYTKQNPKDQEPFDEFDDEFLRLLDEESGGFNLATDRYALLENMKE